MSNDKMIDDLLRRRPKGPRNVKITYEVSEEYCYDRHRHVEYVTPSDISYGYSDEEYFALGLHDAAAVREYLRKRDFEGFSDWRLEGRKATLTRRTNRLWQRIYRGVSAVLKEGRQGIYSVQRRFGSPFGHVYAESMEEAKVVSKIYFGYLLDDPGRMEVSFIRMGGVREMQDLNNKVIQDLDVSIQRNQLKIEELQAEIDMTIARKETLATVEAQQTAVETIGELTAK